MATAAATTTPTTNKKKTKHDESSSGAAPVKKQKKTPNPTLTSHKNCHINSYTFNTKVSTIEQLNALDTESKEYRAHKNTIIKAARVKLSTGRATIDTWKKHHEEYKELVALGFGECYKRPPPATVENARKTLQPPANSAYQFILQNTPSSAEVSKINNFIGEAKKCKGALMSNGNKITGSASYDINFRGQTGCEFAALQKIVGKNDGKNYITKALCKSLVAPCLHQVEELDDYQLDTGSLIFTTAKESQSTHMDMASQPGFNNKLGGIVHGIVHLNPNCRAPILYDMSEVPDNPSPQDVVDRIGRKKPFPKGSVLPKLLIKNDKDDKGNELNHNILERWGRMVYVSNKQRPRNVCIVPQFSVVVMCGNYVHCGPGCGSGANADESADADDFRVTLFWTARPRSDKVTPPYSDLQMSKEKLYCTLLSYHWDSIRVDYNTAFDKNDFGKLISLKEDIAYLASHWADAIAESAMVGLVDITMPDFMPAKANCLDQLVGEVIDASHKHAKWKNKLTKRQLEDAKQMIASWYISRLVSSRKRYGNKWAYKPGN